MAYRSVLFGETYTFGDIRTLLAKANEPKTGDSMAGIAARSVSERIAAKQALANVLLSELYENPVAPYESDEVTRAAIDSLDGAAYEKIRRFSVGEFRDFLLSTDTDGIRAITNGITPEMASAVTKIMSNLDLITTAKKLPVSAFCNTEIGLPGTLSVRLQPNHPTDSAKGIMASVRDGLSYACGDAVIGVNPATDSNASVHSILSELTDFYEEWRIPTQSCVLSHLTTQMAALAYGAPMDLMFQSIGGSEITNSEFGVSIALIDEAYSMMREMKRSIGENFMYFETGQGSALSANGHHNADQLTMEARAYGLAKRYKPFLVNTVVGFIGPEYLYDGKQIARAAVEDHFMGKLLGLPMGADICYTNHADADQNDIDNITVILASAGCNFVIGVPASDDIMLMYQSNSFHDSASIRELLNLRPTAPFERRMEELGLLYEGKLGKRAGDSAVFGVSAEEGKKHTSARIGVGRAGARFRTDTYLTLRADHSVAVDAVLDDSICPVADLLGFYRMHTLVSSKEEYLRRPDRARCFSEDEVNRLKNTALQSPDIQFIAADGLSPQAIESNLYEMFNTIKSACVPEGLFVRNSYNGKIWQSSDDG